MNLRTRLAASFALVALGTGGAVALAAPIIVQQGFQQVQSAPGGGPSAGPTVAPVASPPQASPAAPTQEPTLSPTPTPTKRPSSTSAPTHTPTPTHHDQWTDPGHTMWPDWQGSTLGGEVVLATIPNAAWARSEVTLVVARIAVPVGEATADAASPSAPPSASPSPVVGLGSTTQVPIDTADVTRATTLRIVLIALLAALIASGIGFFAADRLLRPLRRLQAAASAVAAGDLAQRSGLTDRTDEIGELGRSFDTMADALEVSEATRKRFLQDAVHELRTPITVIEATTSAIIDGVYNPEPRHIETIRSQARLLSRIVDDLRTISLAEAGTLELRREPTEVASTLRRVAEGFRARADTNGVGIEVEAPEAFVVDADPQKLRQVLGSLVDNALRYTPAGGRIVLAASVEARGVRFDVRDSGPGVAPEDLPHVFERFYQADPSRDRARGSSGLGLAIVKALAEAHGGVVGVENAAPGGADFWIMLPAS
jgi:two-component system sensor histidine kinase BaeS